LGEGDCGEGEEEGCGGELVEAHRVRVYGLVAGGVFGGGWEMQVPSG
jgi:hypothetical protein